MRVIRPEEIGLEEIRAARRRLTQGIGAALPRTPLVPLFGEEVGGRILLKLENLQPIGSFKLRGALSALSARDPDELAGGIVTASAGNWAQGVAWVARQLGVPCRVLVPDDAPRRKVDAIRALGGEVTAVPFPDWWRAIETGAAPGFEGLFVHPVCDPHVIAGNATVGLEILEDAPDVDAVVVPYGGGGLAGGIAAALCALRPEARVFASEIETAAPLAASLAAGSPREVERIPSFVDGIGGKAVLPEMWELASSLLAGSLVVTLEETASAVRRLALENRVVAEGAGATSVAAALGGGAGTGRIACVVSGGNIDAAKLGAILRGTLPA